MMLVLSAMAVAGGLLAGRWVASRHVQKGLPPGEPAASEATKVGADGRMDSEHADPWKPSAASEETVDWSVFPCGLGDVVIRTEDSAEAWLAGAIVLREDAPAAVLFVAPDAAGERAIYARPRPSVEIAWLVPVQREAIAVGSEPPSALEIEGVRFDRRRRLPLRAQRVGTGAPDVEGTTIIGEYLAATGEVLIVLIAEGVGRAWRGARLEEGTYEVWGGEKSRTADRSC
jgi:hypothetical protein